MSDVAEVRKALVAKLESDSTLVGLAPDPDDATKAAVYLSVSPIGVTKAIIVSPVIGGRRRTLRSTAYERHVFLVKGIERSTSTTGVDALAARIDVLLDAQPLTVTGYKHMVTLLEEDGVVRYAEVDDDQEEHWQHAGGRYEVFAQPTS